MGKKACVIVGGGLTGLFAAIVAADKFEKVYVVDKEKQCGGLLRSTCDSNGVFFDMGTHVPDATRVPAIDEILFNAEGGVSENWNHLGRLRTGNYFAGKWNLENPTIDIRNLPGEVYQRAIAELMQRNTPSSAQNIATYLMETLGPTLTGVVAPIAAKLYGADVDPSTLTTQTSVNYFGLSRVLAFDPQITAKLKDLPAFDAKLGYHTNAEWETRQKRDAMEERENYYPKHGRGVMYWVDSLHAKAKAKGVEFVMQDWVSAISSQNRTIESVTLGASGRKVSCDAVVWSVPPAFALKAAGITTPKANVRFKTANAFHFSYDKPLTNNDSHYLWNWEAKHKTFRVTLYPNLRIDHDSPSCLTAEVLSDRHDADATTLESVHKEILEMGLVPQDAKIITQLKQTVHDTFPVPTFEFASAMKASREQLVGEFDNLLLCGRYGGKAWFHKDVAQEVYAEIGARWG